MLVLPIALLSEPLAYRIVDVRRSEAFAGKLGRRVFESLLVESGGVRILVHVAGSYHTLAVREGARLHVGDTVTIRTDLKKGGEATVARGRIRRLRP